MTGRLSAPDTDKGRLQRAILGIYHEHEAEGMLPTSGRFIFYELVAQGVVDKSKARGKPGVVGHGSDQYVNEALTHLRENGFVPWEAIEDETRVVEHYTGFPSVKDGVLATLPGIRLDPWPDAPPLILCESRSLMGVLRPVAHAYCVPIASLNGQSGGFLRTALARLVSDAGVRDVLYLGDFDFQGHGIEQNARAVLSAYGDLDWERVALTRQQVEEHDLPVVMKGDKRFKDGRAHEAVETEALGQRLIVAILRERLSAMLPAGVDLDSVRVRERDERAAIEAALGAVP